VFWNFSGRPPVAGQGDESGCEPPRWRSNAFAAVNSFGSKFRVAFKAVRFGEDDGEDEADEEGEAAVPDVTGIYVVKSGSAGSPQTLVDTTWQASKVDADAPASTTSPVMVTAVGIERDAFRSDGLASTSRVPHCGYLTINASMANADATVTWAGIYVRRLTNQ
jgi:hypothetical protein